MTPGIMLVREGQYALALLPGPSMLAAGLILVPSVQVRGDVLPGAIGLVLLDMLILSAGVRPPGLTVGQVIEQ